MKMVRSLFLRMFMMFKWTGQPAEILEQTFPSLENGGFVVVEWGGIEVNEPEGRT